MVQSSADQDTQAGPRVRLPSADVNQPAPLPVLARPPADRAPLDDPTGEASLAAALRATPPGRAGPTPFVRLNLPEPFEHRKAAPARPGLDEEPAPPLLPPRLPRP